MQQLPSISGIENSITISIPVFPMLLLPFLNISQHQEEAASYSQSPCERREQRMYLKAPLQHPKTRQEMVPTQRNIL
jgi:hypothetical protein